MKWIKTLIALAVFAGSLALIIIGQMKTGLLWLGLMLLGLCGLLILLYWYNSLYTRAERQQRMHKKHR